MIDELKFQYLQILEEHIKDLDSNVCFDEIPLALSNDYDIAQIVIERYYNFLQGKASCKYNYMAVRIEKWKKLVKSISFSILSDKNFIIKNCFWRFDILEFIPKNLFYDVDFSKKILTKQPYSILFFPPQIRKNKKTILFYLDFSSFGVRQLTRKLRSDYDVVSKAIQKRGSTLFYANRKFLHDKNLVITAIQNGFDHILLLSKPLSEDLDIWTCYIAQYGITKTVEKFLKKDWNKINLILENPYFEDDIFANKVDLIEYRDKLGYQEYLIEKQKSELAEKQLSACLSKPKKQKTIFL